MPLPQHTPEQVLRYSGVISAILNNWPNAVRINCPYNLSPITFIARLRDAIRGQLLYQYPNTQINTEKLLTIRPDLVITQRNNTILAGHYDSLKVSPDNISTGIEVFQPDVNNPQGLLISNPHMNTTTAVTWLHHVKVLNTPSKFTSLSDVERQRIQSYTQTLDISAIDNPDGSITIL